MQRKTLIGTGMVGLALLGSGLWISKHQNKSTPKPGEPQETAEEVLFERARQSGAHLASPLGKAVAAKDWAKIDQLYHPKADFNEMAEIVRALFIESKMTTYTPVEQAHLLTYMLESLNQLEEKNLHLTGLLTTQVERMPSPQHDSVNFKTLKKWLTDITVHPLKRRIAVQKLALQDLKPDSAALQIFRQGLIQGTTLGASRTEWIQLVDDTRNVSEQNISAKYLLDHYTKIPKDAQPSALVILSRHSDISPDAIRSLALHSFKSEEITTFEASLRAIGNLLDAKLLNSPDKSAIVKKLTTLNASLQTPFVAAKSQELLNILNRK